MNDDATCELSGGLLKRAVTGKCNVHIECASPDKAARIIRLCAYYARLLRMQADAGHLVPRVENRLEVYYCRTPEFEITATVSAAWTPFRVVRV